MRALLVVLTVALVFSSCLKVATDAVMCSCLPVDCTMWSRLGDMLTRRNQVDPTLLSRTSDCTADYSTYFVRLVQCLSKPQCHSLAFTCIKLVCALIMFLFLSARIRIFFHGALNLLVFEAGRPELGSPADVTLFVVILAYIVLDVLIQLDHGDYARAPGAGQRRDARGRFRAN